jgi:DNA invertase Pin-like site-specific DNA recombinase
MSGTRAERPVLSKLLENLRPGDILVIWKLDRLGRSLKHLIEVVNELMTRKIGLKSLNDPIDTTTPQGQLIFNLFASLSDYAKRGIMQSHNAKIVMWPCLFVGLNRFAVFSSATSEE